MLPTTTNTHKLATVSNILLQEFLATTAMTFFFFCCWGGCFVFCRFLQWPILTYAGRRFLTKISESCEMQFDHAIYLSALRSRAQPLVFSLSLLSVDNLSFIV